MTDIKENKIIFYSEGRAGATEGSIQKIAPLNHTGPFWFIMEVPIEVGLEWGDRVKVTVERVGID